MLDSGVISSIDQLYYQRIQFNGERGEREKKMLLVMFSTRRASMSFACARPIAHSRQAPRSRLLPPDITELDDLAAGQVDDDTDIRDTFPYLMYYQCHFDEAVVIDLNGTQSRTDGV